MSFSGDLEHLPIVDVIQLIHSTQKSGTLCITSNGKECQLVFDRGFIISANHANNNVKIGQILVEMGRITQDQLDHTLTAQKEAGDKRLPLIAALIESQLIQKEDAFKGLEALIHLTIVQILAWGKGTFSLEVESAAVGDNYRYFPEQLHEDFLLGAQGVLMDALRIFDEKMRDGELDDGIWKDDEPVSEDAGFDLSEELLGLDELDKLDRDIPQVYSGLREQTPVAPIDVHREQLSKLLPDSSDADIETFCEYLKTFSETESTSPPAEGSSAMVLFSHDELLKYAIMTILKPQGFQVFATGDAADLEFMTGQHLSKGIIPLVVFDSPAHCGPGATGASVAEQRKQLGATHPQAAIVQMAAPNELEFMLQSYRDGVRAVLPRNDQDAATSDSIDFLTAFQDFTTNYFERQSRQPFTLYKNYREQLENLTQAPEISVALLGFVADMFQRGLTLIVAKGELVAERGIGINAKRADGPTRVPKINLSLTEDSIFRQVVTDGKVFYGESNDHTLKDQLFSVIETPRTERILLLPFKSRGRVIALIYADFGENAPTAARIDLLEALASQAGLIFDEALYRKQLEKSGN